MPRKELDDFEDSIDLEDERERCDACGQYSDVCEVCGGTGWVSLATAEHIRATRDETFSLWMEIEPTNNLNAWRWTAYRRRGGADHWEVVAESPQSFETEAAAERDSERARPKLVHMLSAEVGMGKEDGLTGGPGFSELLDDESGSDSED